MPPSRRNAITREDGIAVAIVAAASGVLAALSGASPTGDRVPDALVCFAVAAFVTWAGASAPWWALGVGGGIAAIAAVGGPWVLVIVATVATIGAFEIGYRQSAATVGRAVITGQLSQVLARLEMDRFFLDSALVATVAGGLIVISGVLRRRGYVRRRVWWSLAGVAVAAVAASAGFGVGALQAKDPATEGYRALLLGLDRMQDGDLPGAQVALTEATAALRSGGEDLSGPLTQPARFVPFIAQNRSGGADLLFRAADASEAAANALSFVDLDQLQIVNGVIDVGALEVLAPPLADLERTVLDLVEVLDEADSPWLVAPFKTRLDSAQERAEQVSQLATGVSTTARVGPSLLGADGPRRYLFMFASNAEMRGTNGLMGNWSEVTIDSGRLRVTDSGRAAELSNALKVADPLYFEAPDDFFARYGPFGAGSRTEPVFPKYLSNITMPPDMPTVGSTSAQYYEAATGREVDGVFVVDPRGLAALLDVTGPIQVDGLDTTLTAGNVEQFLYLDQYEFVENERRDLLAAVTEKTVEAILSTQLPAPQEVARKLGPAAVSGHISAWVSRPEEQELLEVIGIDNSLPQFEGEYTYSDGLAVVTDNASGNKIDSFLQREIRYSPVYDQNTGEMTGTVEVVLTNNAPTTGYPDYVIGNIVGLPTGSNQMIVTLYTRLAEAATTVDGASVEPVQYYELGWNVYTTSVIVPPGESRTITYELVGRVGSGGYGLVYRPQALPRPDQVLISATSPGGDQVLRFEGVLERRSVLTPDGVEAWRTPTAAGSASAE